MIVLQGFALSFIVTTLLIPAAMQLARRWDILDYPTGELKTHAEPIPYLGGLALAGGVLAATAVYARKVGFPSELCGLMAGTAVILFLGLSDDLKPLSPYVRLAIQALAAALVVKGGIRVQIQALPHEANLAITFIWLVGVTNAFNLIDVHDGLCSGTAMIVSLGLVLVAHFTPIYDRTYVAVAAGALAGAALAFLNVNHPPAKMFLGDAGSLTAGFWLASLAIAESYTVQHPVGFIVPLILFIVPLYEIVFVVILRILSGRSPLRGSPDHIAIRLRSLGWTPRRVLWSMLGVSLIGALLAPMVAFLPMQIALFEAAAALCGALALGWALARIPVKRP